MSQYPSMPPPGAYIPPNQNQNTPPQGYGAQHQQQGYQQPQVPTTYQSSAQGHGQPSQSHKASGGTFGQMMNQAVTTGKPMLNKLSKTISSKLGNKPSTPGTPQHLPSYQNYQQHQGQQTQTHGQQIHQQPQAPSTYPPQQSPYQQPNYGPAQGNYFTQQASTTPQTPYTQATPPPQQPSQTGYNGTQFGQGGNTVGEQHVQAQQAQHQQVQMGQTLTPAQYQQQPLQAQCTGQQMYNMGGSQYLQQSSNPQSPQISNASPHSPAPQRTQWHNSHAGSEQSFVSTYPQQPPAPTAHTQSYFPNANVQTQPNSQQWAPLSPTGAEGQSQSQMSPASISPPPPPLVQSKPPVVPSASPQQSHSSTPAPQSTTMPGSPTEFIAELPADMGNLSLAEAKPQEHTPMPPSGQTSTYQAYQSSTAQAGPSSPGFTIARRAVSMSNMPYADPWRFADPLTELPTREFYVIADLLFDGLNRSFEPRNTGMLEASKILKSWIDLTEDAIQLFSYNSYSAFGKMWSLQGIPHVMVPCRPSLSPIWHFDQHSHAHELKLSPGHTHAATYATYMPALNRAGWYKFFFLEMMHGPDNINKLMPALCSDTYKPGVLHHPDLTKRDKAEAPALRARAAEIQATAINQRHLDAKTMLKFGTTTGLVGGYQSG